MAGIYTLQDLRDSAPEHLRDVSDEQLVLEYSNSIGRDAFEIAPYFGIATGAKRGDFMGGMAAGVDQVQGMLYSAGGAIADAAGAEGLRDKAMRAAERQDYESYFARNPNTPQRIEDVEGVGDFIDYAQGQIGQQVPIMGGIIAGGALTGGLGYGAALGAGTVGYGYGVGSLYKESVEGGNPDAAGSLLGGIPYAAAEALVPALATRAILGRGVMADLTGGRLARAAKGGALGGGAEVGTELFQTELEMGMRNDLTEEEQYSRRLNAAVSALIVGGALSGATSAIPATKVPDTEGNTGTDQQMEGADLTTPSLPQPQDYSGYDTPAAGRMSEDRQARLDNRSRAQQEADALAQQQEEDKTIASEFSSFISGIVGAIKSNSDLGERQVARIQNDIATVDTQIEQVKSEIAALDDVVNNPPGTGKAKKAAKQVAYQKRKARQEYLAQLEQNKAGLQVKIDRSNLRQESVVKQSILETAVNNLQQYMADPNVDTREAFNMLTADQQMVLREASPTLAARFPAETTDTTVDTMATNEVVDSTIDAGVATAQVEETQQPTPQREERIQKFDEKGNRTVIENQDDPIVAARELGIEIDPNTGKLLVSVETPKGRAIGVRDIAQNIVNTAATAFLRNDIAPVIEFRAMDVNGKETFALDTGVSEAAINQARSIIDAARRVVEMQAKFSNSSKNLFHGFKDAQETDRNVDKPYSNALREGQLLRNAMDALIEAAGSEKNAEAFIAKIKTKNAKNAGSTTIKPSRLADLMSKRDNKSTRELRTIMDVLLSNAFADFKDGTLGSLDKVGRRESRMSYERGSVGNLTEGMTAAEVLQNMRKGVSSAYVKEFANIIGKAIGKLTSISGNNFTIAIAERGGEAKPSYDPTTGVITLYRDTTEEEALHEIVHAATATWAYENQNSQEVQDLIDSLETLLDAVDNGVVERSNLTQAAQDNVNEIIAVIRGLRDQGDMMSAVLELVAYGTTAANFRDLVKTIPEVSNRSASKNAARGGLGTLLNAAWQQVLKVFKRVLGVSDTVANNILEASISIMANVQDSGVVNSTVVGKPTLNMAVSSITERAGRDDQVTDASGRPVNSSRYADKGARNIVSMFGTERLFGLIGNTTLGKLVRNKVFESAAAVDKWFESKPYLAKFLANFNSLYSVPMKLRDLFYTWKEDRNTAYLVLDGIAGFMDDKTPAEAKAIIQFLDSEGQDSTMLDALPNQNRAKNIKGETALVLKAYKGYIAEMPEGPVRASFENQTFSEALIYADTESSVSSHKVGLKSLKDQLASKYIRIKNEDIATNMDLLGAGLNGEMLDGDTFYAIELVYPNGKSERLLVSKTLYDRNGGQQWVDQTLNTALVGTRADINNKTEYALRKFSNDGYNFSAKGVDLTQDLDEASAKRIANAMRNTMGGLANNFASRKFFASLAEKGKEMGVVFDDEASLTASGLLPEGKKVAKVKDLTSDELKEDTRLLTAWIELDGERYGEMNGKIVRGDVLAAMNDMSDRKPVIAKEYTEFLRYFKKTKTIHNPGTHITNIAGNVMLGMMHDISFRNMAGAAKLLWRYETGANITDDERAMVLEFKSSGAMLGNYSSVEVKKVMYEGVSENFVDSKDTGIFARIGAFASHEVNKSKILKSLVAKGLSADEAATQLYAAEDNAFRFAAFMKQMAEVENSQPDMAYDQKLRTAGRAARQMFLDYDIDARAVKVARQTAFPFISWTYAAAPVIGRMALHQPWKIANVMLALAAVDILASALAGDDDEMRERIDDKYNDRLWGFGPHAYIRIPFLGDDKNPVYYRWGKYFPLDDTFEKTPTGFMGQDWWPQGLTPGGPIATTVIAALQGLDPYTGKHLYDDADGNLKRGWETTKVLFDQVLPPFAGKFAYGEYEKALSGEKSISGNPVNVTQILLARLMGLQVKSLNTRDEAMFREIRASKAARDYKSKISALSRDASRQGFYDYEAFSEDAKDLEMQLVDEYKKIYRLED